MERCSSAQRTFDIKAYYKNQIIVYIVKISSQVGAISSSYHSLGGKLYSYCYHTRKKGGSVKTSRTLRNVERTREALVWRPRKFSVKKVSSKATGPILFGLFTTFHFTGQNECTKSYFFKCLKLTHVLAKTLNFFHKLCSINFFVDIRWGLWTIEL